MNSKSYLIVIVFFLIFNNLLQLLKTPIYAVINLILIVIAIILYFDQRHSEKYDYNAENPNALICGKNIAGTVYSAYPDNVPGLGWIL